MNEVELVVDAHAVVGEGPIWDGQKGVLYWVDIMANKLHIYDHGSGADVEHDVGQPVGTVVQRASGGLMFAMHHGFAAYDLESRKLELIADPEADLPKNRFNEGKCDPGGRFWAGTMAIDEVADAGGLYCLDTDLSVRRVFGRSPSPTASAGAWTTKPCITSIRPAATSARMTSMWIPAQSAMKEFCSRCRKGREYPTAW